MLQVPLQPLLLGHSECAHAAGHVLLRCQAQHLVYQAAVSILFSAANNHAGARLAGLIVLHAIIQSQAVAQMLLQLPQALGVADHQACRRCLCFCSSLQRSISK